MVPESLFSTEGRNLDIFLVQSVTIDYPVSNVYKEDDVKGFYSGGHTAQYLLFLEVGDT